MKIYIKASNSASTWSPKFKSSKYGLDGEIHPISIREFDNGYLAAVFYDDASYCIFDNSGQFIDGDAASNIREAKRSAENYVNSLD